MKTKYKKLSLPLSKVTGRHFLSRPLGCHAVGMSLVRFKPGEGGAFVHRHKVQEEVYMILKGTGSIILDGRRHSMPEGTIVRVSPRVNRAIGNDSRRDVIFAVLGAIPPQKNSPWRKDPAGRQYPGKREDRAMEKVQEVKREGIGLASLTKCG